MAAHDDRPFVDAQVFTDLDTFVYEAVATLEYAGQPTTRTAIMAATELDDPTVSEVLDALTEHGVLIRTAADGEDTFALARRDWSAAPGTRSGQPWVDR
jgi:DNA-binding IclR family transcriptional regulator